MSAYHRLKSIKMSLAESGSDASVVHVESSSDTDKAPEEGRYVWDKRLCGREVFLSQE